MDTDYWHNRWQQGEIGFHLSRVHPLLAKYFPQQLQQQAIFVPLCGKSLDMTFLAQQGCFVCGVELSDSALEEFASEQQLSLDTEQQGQFKVWHNKDYRLLAGDFFNLTAAQVKECHQIYDRAALIALPADMREDYVAHLKKIMPRPVKILLITLDYDQQQMAGPPFSVDEAEVTKLFHWAAQITVLQRQDIIEQETGFKDKGLTSIFQTAYVITA